MTDSDHGNDMCENNEMEFVLSFPCPICGERAETTLREPQASEDESRGMDHVIHCPDCGDSVIEYYDDDDGESYVCQATGVAYDPDARMKEILLAIEDSPEETDDDILRLLALSEELEEEAWLSDDEETSDYATLDSRDLLQELVERGKTDLLQELLEKTLDCCDILYEYDEYQIIDEICSFLIEREDLSPSVELAEITLNKATTIEDALEAVKLIDSALKMAAETTDGSDEDTMVIVRGNRLKADALFSIEDIDGYLATISNELELRKSIKTNDDDLYVQLADTYSGLAMSYMDKEDLAKAQSIFEEGIAYLDGKCDFAKGAIMFDYTGATANPEDAEGNYVKISEALDLMVTDELSDENMLRLASVYLIRGLLPVESPMVPQIEDIAMAYEISSDLAWVSMDEEVISQVTMIAMLYLPMLEESDPETAASVREELESFGIDFEGLMESMAEMFDEEEEEDKDE